MKKSPPDWDKYFGEAKYAEVRGNSPQLRAGRHPTTYSPDKKWLYLSSLDLDVHTEDLDELKMHLASFGNSFDAAKRKGDFHAQSRIWIDCIEVCGLVSELDDDPSLYGDPEEFLKASPSAK